MSTLRIPRQLLLILSLVFLLAAAAAADERMVAEVLPPDIVAFAEIPQPQDLLSTVYDHEIIRRIEALDQVRVAMEQKQYLDFKAGVAIVESQMGLPWRKIVANAMGRGIYFAADAKTQGVVVLARAADDTTQARLLATLANLASADAKNKGQDDPVKTGEYRGIKAYAVDKSKFAVVADWLIVTNHQELGKKIIDRLLDKPKESLAANAEFAKARGAVRASTTAWAYVNTAALREAGLAKELFGGQADNPAAELIFGGILSTLRETPYVTVGLEVSDQQVRLSASAPFDRSWAGDLREYFFGPQGGGNAPARLSVDGTILSLSTYRDVSAMWLRAGDLFNEQMNEELAKADSGLTTLFAGKDFGEDILGALQPEVQLVVALQQFAAGQPTPAIKLPAFGLVADLKDPEKMQPELRRTFQSLVGFLNIVGAMNGQPQLDLDMEKSDDVQLVTSSYLADPTAKDPQALKINYNFSPSIAFAGSRFVVASTNALARSLATAEAAERPDSDEIRVVNTDAILHADPLREILTENRGQLVAQNMLEEGHSKDEAEREIGTLLELVGWFDRLLLSLDTTQSELRLSVDLGIKAGE
jgi:hypothetical protein